MLGPQQPPSMSCLSALYHCIHVGSATASFNVLPLCYISLYPCWVRNSLLQCLTSLLYITVSILGPQQAPSMSYLSALYHCIHVGSATASFNVLPLCYISLYPCWVRNSLLQCLTSLLYITVSILGPQQAPSMSCLSAIYHCIHVGSATASFNVLPLCCISLYPCWVRNSLLQCLASLLYITVSMLGLQQAPSMSCLSAIYHCIHVGSATASFNVLSLCYISLYPCWVRNSILQCLASLLYITVSMLGPQQAPSMSCLSAIYHCIHVGSATASFNVLPLCYISLYPCWVRNSLLQCLASLLYITISMLGPQQPPSMSYLSALYHCIHVGSATASFNVLPLCSRSLNPCWVRNSLLQCLASLLYITVSMLGPQQPPLMTWDMIVARENPANQTADAFVDDQLPDSLFSCGDVEYYSRRSYSSVSTAALIDSQHLWSRGLLHLHTYIHTHIHMHITYTHLSSYVI